MSDTGKKIIWDWKPTEDTYAHVGLHCVAFRSWILTTTRSLINLKAGSYEEGLSYGSYSD